MDVQPIKLKLRNVDLASLQTEDDYRKLAHRLLPDALIQLGESRGAKTWDQVQENRKRSPATEPNLSPEDKNKFVRDMGLTYRRQANDKDRVMLEQLIISQLKEQKAGG